VQALKLETPWLLSWVVVVKDPQEIQLVLSDLEKPKRHPKQPSNMTERINPVRT
jgi:hypothetical protein